MSWMTAFFSLPPLCDNCLMALVPDISDDILDRLSLGEPRATEEEIRRLMDINGFTYERAREAWIAMVHFSSFH